MIRPRRRSWPLALLASGALLLSGCAEFDDSAAGQNWQPAPELTPEAGPQPELPEAGTPAVPSGPPTSQTPIPPPDGCKDFDKAVIATCLDTVSAVAALPTDGSTIGALAAERKSGRVFLVGAEAEKSEFATLDVVAQGDGGLTGLALSPTYGEDGLVFAYVTTPTDNRVVRFAQGQPPKPVLTGIPKGQTGNRGALLTDGNGSLLVATGDAGNAAAAADPGSLAGKVLRITPAGLPAEGNPRPDSPVLASGLHNPGGMCKTTDGSRLWVTDQGPEKDALYRIQPGSDLSVPAWTWPDQPGVTGCTDWTDVLAVATSTGANVQNLPLTEDGSVGGKPQVTMDGNNGTSYGKLGALDPVTPDVAVAGTINKDGGTPVSSDDRVVLVVRQPASGSGRD
ncbi:PQQ-dependent sugar dehydrogenase [Prauserella flavalba]|uniref:Glucose dehydrogenase n=1 Tax=Prauserella flavalba TaxID=1477506 RepID=A0A318LFE2_9PSEU|nr:PQQ-dependent sugar dehydrogenase [Prauserella flavalba]PXY24569.1 glucose dehydrogenase [Prauserella flavalba]